MRVSPTGVAVSGDVSVGLYTYQCPVREPSTTGNMIQHHTTNLICCTYGSHKLFIAAYVLLPPRNKTIMIFTCDLKPGTMEICYP